VPQGSCAEQVAVDTPVSVIGEELRVIRSSGQAKFPTDDDLEARAGCPSEVIATYDGNTAIAIEPVEVGVELR
jgi:hypothetical protein